MPTYNLPKQQSLAFVMSPRLGDALIAMVIVNNLQRNGYQITVFSQHLWALKNWFADFNILPFPTDSKAFIPFDKLLHVYPVDVLFEEVLTKEKIIILDHHPEYRRCISMVDLQVFFCEHIFNLQNVVRYNGIKAPYPLEKNNQRVIIHPTASHQSKCWLPARFIELAQGLKQRNFQVVFVAAPFEVAHLTWIQQNNFELFIPESLDHLAALLISSRICIGNDSGICHLASCLGIPTITLHQRRKNKIRWHPDWALNIGILPRFPLFVKTWKEKYWKYLISSKQVLKAFDVCTKT
jgi:hypothetical protein